MANASLGPLGYWALRVPIRERERERESPEALRGAPARGQPILTPISGASPSGRVRAVGTRHRKTGQGRGERDSKKTKRMNESSSRYK